MPEFFEFLLAQKFVRENVLKETQRSSNMLLDAQSCSKKQKEAQRCSQALSLLTPV
jgi:hypothetical protein